VYSTRPLTALGSMSALRPHQRSRRRTTNMVSPFLPPAINNNGKTWQAHWSAAANAHTPRGRGAFGHEWRPARIRPKAVSAPSEHRPSWTPPGPGPSERRHHRRPCSAREMNMIHCSTNRNSPAEFSHAPRPGGPIIGGPRGGKPPGPGPGMKGPGPIIIPIPIPAGGRKPSGSGAGSEGRCRSRR
jgi:hypothetical protein